MVSLGVAPMAFGTRTMSRMRVVAGIAIMLAPSSFTDAASVFSARLAAERLRLHDVQVVLHPDTVGIPVRHLPADAVCRPHRPRVLSFTATWPPCRRDPQPLHRPARKGRGSRVPQKV